MSFSCDVTMINATAEVKPELTGPETKSIRKPEIKISSFLQKDPTNLALIRILARSS